MLLKILISFFILPGVTNLPSSTVSLSDIRMIGFVSLVRTEMSFYISDNNFLRNSTPRLNTRLID